MKLEHRLALLTGSVTAGTIALCLLTAFGAVFRSATEELDESVIDGADAAAVVVSQMEAEVKATGPRALEIPDEVALLVQRIAVYSTEGARIATRPGLAEIPYRLEELKRRQQTARNRPFDLALPEGAMRAVLVSGHGLDGMWVLHAMPRRHLDEVIASRGRLFVGLYLATLAIVVLAALWLGRRLAADVSHVTQVARRVASGELTARTETSRLTSPETRNLARELDHMVAELAALVASQRGFISYAAHELRSPLAALKGELQLALRRPRTEESYVETLSSALTDVVTLTQLAEDLLTLAKAQASRVTEEHTPVEHFVEDALGMVQGAAQVKETTLAVDITAVRQLVVLGRRSELRRMLRNLLENAIKFGPRGGTVRLTGELRGERVELVVEDEGPGLAPSDLANLFSPFFRSTNKATAETSGTGLGLAIAREIAQNSGGNIHCDPEHAHGACFVAELRRAQGDRAVEP